LLERHRDLAYEVRRIGRPVRKCSGLAAIIRGADLPLEEDRPPESPCVLAIFDGIRDGSATDQERLERGCVVCDALYIYCQADVRAAT
jgi:hypothetical protein